MTFHHLYQYSTFICRDKVEVRIVKMVSASLYIVSLAILCIFLFTYFDCFSTNNIVSRETIVVGNQYTIGFIVYPKIYETLYSFQ